jgi:hypothetical protein
MNNYVKVWGDWINYQWDLSGYRASSVFRQYESDPFLSE